MSARTGVIGEAEASSDAVPLSSPEQVIWPAIPVGLSAQLLAMQHQLAQSEWWSGERLADCQFRQLTRLVEHAYDKIPFYRPRLAAVGYRPGQAITGELWSTIPIVTRREVQELGDAGTCTDLPAGHGAVSTSATSGSTGTPLNIVQSELADVLFHALTLREALWHRRDFRLKLGAIKRDPEGLATPPSGRKFANWLAPIALCYSTGQAVLLDNRIAAREQAEWLLREEPDYLVTFPSVAQDVARYILAHGLRLNRLKSINTMGEVVSPQLRALCREALGVGIVDMYSATEIGYLALQCPVGEHYHVQSEAAMVEVIDDAGRPCRPGEIGQVVATPLHNFAMPLIRYAIGDLAEVGFPCPCGRGLPVLSQILGRTRDTLMMPTGERRYAQLGFREFAKFRELVQFQVIQKTIADLEVKLVVRQTLPPETEEKLRRMMRQHAGEHFSITFTYHDEIPRASSGKYFDFISEVAG